MSYFLNTDEIVQTIRMIEQEHLDVRTITLGLSLLDCATGDIKRTADKVYEKICREAHDLVPVGEAIEREFGIPIVNKRVSVTPVALIAGGCGDDLVPIAEAMDRAAREVGVNFIGGFSALVQKGFTTGDRSLIASIPEALARTERVCASVNVGSTRAGINMDAVAEMGRVIKKCAALTADTDGLACSKLVVFCNAVEDNPFMAGAFHGAGEAESAVNVGVSGPGVVYQALQECKGESFDVVAETIKRTAFKVTRMGQLVAREASRRAVRHRRSLARADPGGGRQRGAHSRNHGTGGLRHPRHDRRACPAERRGEEGRRDGLRPRRRALRRVYPGLGGRGHDRRGARGNAHAR